MHADTRQILAKYLKNSINDVITAHDQIKEEVLRLIPEELREIAPLRGIDQVINSNNNSFFFSRPGSNSRLKKKLIQLNQNLEFVKEMSTPQTEPELEQVKKQLIIKLNAVVTQRVALRNGIIQNLKAQTSLNGLVDIISKKIDSNVDFNWKPGILFGGSQLRAKLLDCLSDLKMIQNLKSQQEKIQFDKEEVKEQEQYDPDDKKIDVILREEMILQEMLSRQYYLTLLQDYLKKQAKVQYEILGKSQADLLKIRLYQLDLFYGFGEELQGDSDINRALMHPRERRLENALINFSRPEKLNLANFSSLSAAELHRKVFLPMVLAVARELAKKEEDMNDDFYWALDKLMMWGRIEGDDIKDFIIRLVKEGFPAEKYFSPSL